jgi:hypothetical protein
VPKIGLKKACALEKVRAAKRTAKKDKAKEKVTVYTLGLVSYYSITIRYFVEFVIVDSFVDVLIYNSFQSKLKQKSREPRAL